MAVRATKHAAVLLMGLVGAFSAFMIAASICVWLFPDSNLAPLPAVFIAAPIGLMLGFKAGVRLLWSPGE
jgi:hypothetical protein